MRSSSWFVLGAAALALAACGKPTPHPAHAAGPAPAATSSPQAPPPGPADGPSLVSLAMGAYPLVHPDESTGAYTALNLMDEIQASVWFTPDGDVKPQTIVIALPERTLLKTLTFDCSRAIWWEAGTCAKDIVVEMSDASPDAGYVEIARVSLAEGADNQRFAASLAAPGRWVRLRVLNNHGSAKDIQLNDFRAAGVQLTHTAQPDVSGTYETDAGWMRIRQEGTAVTGCYYGRSGMFQGGLDNRAVRSTFCENCVDKGDTPNHGRMVWAFSPAGDRFTGFYWNEGQTGQAEGMISGRRTNRDVGQCPQWVKAASGVEGQVAQDLAGSGRVRLYGVNFDSDSDQIRPESAPMLEHIAAVLKAHPDWRLAVEGHTDSTSTPEHNQTLSERRAAAVSAWLTAHAVEAARLSAKGLGQTRPVADNDSELGRSQNRRVELARQ